MAWHRLSEVCHRGGRSRSVAWVSAIGRVAFSLFYILFFSTPSWRGGVFSWIPMVTLRLHDGLPYTLGLLTLLPAVVVVAWLSGYVRRSGRLRWSWGPAHVALPVLGLGLLVLIRAVPVQSSRVSITAVLAVFLFWFSYFYTLQDYAPSYGVTVFAILLIGAGIVGGLQFILQRSVGLAFLGELHLHPEGQLVSVVEVGGIRWLRAYGLTPHPNLLGGYLCLWLVVCLGYAIHKDARHSPWQRSVLWMALGIGGMGIFFSFSRSAWLGLLLSLLYLAAIQPQRFIRALRGANKPLLLVVGAFALLLAVLLWQYRALWLTRLLRLDAPLESRSIRERFEDIVQAWGLIRERPYLGVGSGYYLGALWERAGANPPPGFRLIHNIPLLAMAELGPAGPVLWLWMLLGPPVVLWRAVRRQSVRGGVFGWAAACVVATVLSMFDSYLYLPVTFWPTLCLGVMMGMWAQLCQERPQRGGGEASAVGDERT